MRDKMQYVNHVGEVVKFGQGQVLINENDFRDFEWAYNSQFKKISFFDRGVAQKSLPVIVVGMNCKSIANEIFEKLEKDVLAGKPGRMYIGDYYLKGYFYTSKKSGYTKNLSINLELNFVSDQKYWIAESTYLYRTSDGGSEDTRGLGYSHGYPYDFLSPINTQSLHNTAFTDSHSILKIYGPVSNPALTIGGNTYKVNTEILNNEYLTINTMEKTIVKTTAKGTSVNEFANRDIYAGYVFQKIPSGLNSVIVTPNCNFDITILEERSEPKWI